MASIYGFRKHWQRLLPLGKRPAMKPLPMGKIQKKVGLGVLMTFMRFLRAVYFFEKERSNEKSLDKKELDTSMVTSDDSNVEFRKFNYITKAIELKARTQNVTEYKYDQDDEIVVEKSLFQEGVCIGNSISKPENGYIKLAMVNANTKKSLFKIKKAE